MCLSAWLGDSTEEPDFDHRRSTELSWWLYHRLDDMPALQAYQPTISGDMIEFWENKIKRDRGVRITIKPGKALKKIFPDLGSASLARMVDQYKAHFVPIKVTIHRSQSASAFKHAYSHTPTKQRDVATCRDRKALDNSCMRYEFKSLPHHPAEVYASGDFEIIWAETDDGKIAGRCVVCTKFKPGRRGPIYGVSEEVITKLAECLDGTTAGVATWRGARLLRLNFDGGEKVITPYLDIAPRYGKLGRKYIHIGADYDVELSEIDGYHWL